MRVQTAGDVAAFAAVLERFDYRPDSSVGLTPCDGGLDVSLMVPIERVQSGDPGRVALSEVVPLADLGGDLLSVAAGVLDRLTRRFEEHERCEWLRFDGTPIIDPHESGSEHTGAGVLDVHQGGQPVTVYEETSGEALQAFALRYQFMPAEMLVGDPMDTAHLYDGRSINVSWRGGDRWAVEYGHGWSIQEVWSEEDSGWVVEPQPSSRTEDFKRRTRYSLTEALAIGYRLANEHGPAPLSDDSEHTGAGE